MLPWRPLYDAGSIRPVFTSLTDESLPGSGRRLGYRRPKGAQNGVFRLRMRPRQKHSEAIMPEKRLIFGPAKTKPVTFRIHGLARIVLFISC